MNVSKEAGEQPRRRRRRPRWARRKDRHGKKSTEREALRELNESLDAEEGFQYDEEIIVWVPVGLRHGTDQAPPDGSTSGLNTRESSGTSSQCQDASGKSIETHFDVKAAELFLLDRWRAVIRDMFDPSIKSDDRPVVYR